MGFFAKVRRRLGGQRGEDLSYEGWSAELQEDLSERLKIRIKFDKKIFLKCA